MTANTFTVLRRFAAALAGIAATFSIVVAGLLLWLHFSATTNDPWKSPQLLELKEQLQAAPKDEVVKARIRELDFQFRQRYVQRLRLGATGGWLLVAGAVVFVVAFQTAAAAGKRLPQPKPDPQASAHAARRAAQSRRAVAVAGVVCGGTLLVVGWGVPSHFATLPVGSAPPGAAAAAAPPMNPLPPPAEFARQWPRFRGPEGGGVAAGPEAPLNWDAATGAGIAWKAAVPAPGFNSPIVWGGKVFVSGATRESREVFCFDAADGRLVWRCPIPLPKGPGIRSPELSEDTGYAAPTLATDGRQVYALFGHGDLTAVTLAGRVAWTKFIGVPKNPYGLAASLAVWPGRVIVQFDQGESETSTSRLWAFDGGSGRLLWEKARPVGSSWASPIVVEAAGRAQIITIGVPFAIAYAAADGAELWRAKVMEGEVTPSPIYAGGLVVIVNPGHSLIGIRPDGSGDVTGTHVAWQMVEGVPDISSPVSDGNSVYVVNGGGELHCFELKTGAKLWTKDLDAEAHASPILIGRRLYVTCTNGMTVVAETGAAYRELARNRLGEKIYASPAVADGRIYLRGVQHLFCLADGAKPALAAKANPGP